MVFDRKKLLLALLFVITIITMLRLGFWQLDRATQKKARWQSYLSQQNAAPLDLNLLTDLDKHDYVWRTGEVNGHYVALTVLLDNRVYNGRVGYEVLSPFVLSGGPTILVNRGWVPLQYDRAYVPAVTMPVGPRRINGLWALPPVVGIALNAHSSATEPLSPNVIRVQRLDWTLLATRLDNLVIDRVFYLDPADPDAYERNWPVPSDTTGRHRAYALQWFAMAAAVVVIALALLRRAQVHT